MVNGAATKPEVKHILDNHDLEVLGQQSEESGSGGNYSESMSSEDSTGGNYSQSTSSEDSTYSPDSVRSPILKRSNPIRRKQFHGSYAKFFDNSKKTSVENKVFRLKK